MDRPVFNPLPKRSGTKAGDALRAARTSVAPAHQLQTECASASRRGFSLIELLVVLAITVLLASLLMPALSQLRSNVHRVIAASNMRQVGVAVSMYADDNNENLPYSQLLEVGKPEELMAAHMGTKPNAWDGLGLLYKQEYCPAAEVFYAPAHRGNHPFERYELEWVHPSGTTRIYTNFHYSGHEGWVTGLPRTLRDGGDLVVISDGLRTKEDLNHKNGINMLHGDLAVRWHLDRARIFELLPQAGENGDPINTDNFEQIWGALTPGPDFQTESP